jgi:protein-S-isoprenylcysteine O-methyltransferase Ste14
MKKSWRVGIDEQQKTELVTTGIFSYSRNPIYAGMLASVIGLFMVTPNGFTLLLMVAGYLLIQVQVRVEEDFLLKMHGQLYTNYKASVRRFV